MTEKSSYKVSNFLGLHMKCYKQAVQYNTTWLQIQRAKLVKKRLLYHPIASLALHKAIICNKISQHKSITNNIHCTHSQQKKSLILSKSSWNVVT